jgi:translocation and assembly module TamA
MCRALRLLRLAGCLVAVFGTLAAHAAGYTMTIAPTGNVALDRAMSDASTLISLRDSTPASSLALLARTRTDAERFGQALRSFGFYKGTVRLEIAGRRSDDPDLADLLEHRPADQRVPITMTADPGPLFHLREITVVGALPPGFAARLDLHQGAPAVAADVLAARERLLAALRQDGYALARVDEPVALLRAEADALDVSFTVDAGPRVDLGAITINGLRRMNESFVRQRLLIAPGERFDPARIEAARQDLAGLGVFASVRTRMAEHTDAAGRLPLEIDVTERTLRAGSISAAYSTDLGVNLSTSWQHRNLFGNAEQLTLNAGTEYGGTSENRPGYNLGAVLTKPDMWARDQSLSFGLGAISQSLDAYDRNAVTGDVRLQRKFSPHWTAGVGVSGTEEHIYQEGVGRDYLLLSLPLDVRYDSSDSPFDPTRGVRAAAKLTPIRSLAGPPVTFTLFEVSGSTYLDAGTLWGEAGRSIFALRGLLGQAAGASQFQLPPDQRFYAGGSATVRGFRYLSVGPLFPDNKPQGGTAVAAGSVEFRQRILTDYGAVVFVDAGQANADIGPFTDVWRVGAGVGVRYFTSIGPIRVDVAVPLNRPPGGDTFELYVGIGQAF